MTTPSDPYAEPGWTRVDTPGGYIFYAIGHIGGSLVFVPGLSPDMLTHFCREFGVNIDRAVASGVPLKPGDRWIEEEEAPT